VRFVFARVGHALLSMLFLSVFIFGVVRITGDPTYLLLPETASEEQFERLRSQLGLDRPLIEQYAIFLGNIARGDLGHSYRHNVPVAELIRLRFPATLQLGLSALLIALVVGVPLGVYAAYWRGGWLDLGARFLAVLGQSAPAFWVGLILILIVAVRLRWLPSGGYGGFDHLLMPAFTIGFGAIAGLTRLLRSSMIDVLESDYVKFLRLKGLPEREILWKHALRNAGLTSLTFIGVLTAGVLTGSVVTETVFIWPGMGQLMSQAITSRDFAVVQGVVLMFSAVYIVINLMVDLLYAVLNPRLRT
jgi:peptide/nickel transport system permease protein